MALRVLDAAPFLPQREQLAIKLKELLMISFLTQGVVQPAPREGRLARGVRNFAAPGKARELFTPALLHRAQQLLVPMIHHILERRRLAIFFSHEQQRSER